MVRIDVGSPEKENYYAIEFRQDPVTNEIRGHRFINNQWEEGSYPLKPLKGKQIDTLSGIESLIQEKFEPIISKKGEVKWIIPSGSIENEFLVISLDESSIDRGCSQSNPESNICSTSLDSTRSDSLGTLGLLKVVVDEVPLIKKKFLKGNYGDEKLLEERIGKLPLDETRKRTLANAIRALMKPQHSFRRAARSRPGGTDLIIIKTLKQCLKEETLPDDEKQLLETTLEMVLPRPVIIFERILSVSEEGSSTSSSASSEESAYHDSEKGDSNHQIVSPRLHQAQEKFLEFIALRKERERCTPELEHIVERFNVLTEDRASFIKRKENEIHSILSDFPTFGSHS